MGVENLVPIVTAAVAAVGAYLSVWKYLNDTKGDRAERIAAGAKDAERRRRERLDRASAELRAVLERLTSADDRTQLMALVSLEYYFADDSKEFHEQALSALIAVARAEYPPWNELWDQNNGTAQTPPRLRNLALAVERALGALVQHQPEGVRAIRSQSLQRVALPELRLGRFQPLDILRGADLTDACLQRSVLEGLDLSDCRLENTRLQGADLRGCSFGKAKLIYTDLAGADLRGARGLDEAAIKDIKVLDVRVDRTVAAVLRERHVPELWIESDDR